MSFEFIIGVLASLTAAILYHSIKKIIIKINDYLDNKDLRLKKKLTELINQSDDNMSLYNFVFRIRYKITLNYLFICFLGLLSIVLFLFSNFLMLGKYFQIIILFIFLVISIVRFRQILDHHKTERIFTKLLKEEKKLLVFMSKDF